MKYLFFLLLLGLSISLTAQVPEAYFSNLEFRSVGPTRGGRVTAIEGMANQPFTFWMGGSGGGVWKTEDAGQTWSPMGDGQIECGSIGAIAVAPSDPSVIYVGTGSAAPRGNVSVGIGMYRSSNGGKDWQHIGLPKAGQIGQIVVHPKDPQTLYVAALGGVFGKNSERGVYRSRDGGTNWEKVLYLNDSTGAIDLTLNPQDPEEIYAAMWRCERKPWTLIDGGPDGGIWKTANGGDDWEKLTNGLPNGLLGRIGLSVSPANPQTVYAIVQAAEEEEGGVYRSDDAGNSWRRTCRDHDLRQRGWYYSNITAHPTDVNTVYVSNVGFYKSIDGGKNFERVSTPHSDHHGVWINPKQPDIMINCNDGGANISLNGGKSWSTQLNQPTSEFYRLTVDNQFPYQLYAGQQDNTTIGVSSNKQWEVTRFKDWIWAGGGESADIAVDPNDPDIIWAGTYSGEITRLNRKTGEYRQTTAYPHYTEGTEMRKLKYRWQWNFPIVASQHEPGVVYHTSNYVHRSIDQGQSWQVISPDLSRNIDKYMGIPGGPIQHDATGVEVYASIFAFEESPHAKGEFWAGTDDGRLHLTRDGGANWEELSIRGLPYEATINKIELSAHRPGRALVAAYNYRYDDFTPYLFLTDDYGRSWKNIGQGLPERHFVRSVAEDPDREGLVYAGTEFGLYVSFDEGAHWQSLQLNLPHVPITDMEVHQQDLVLSTQGRAFWILDNVTVLHQLTDAVAGKGRHLFEPDPAIRTDFYGFNAQIPLYLEEVPEAAVEIRIKNDSGQVIRKLSTDAGNSRNKIKLQKGLNIVEWNLEHEGPKLVDNLVTMVISNPPNGPKAVPGTYTIDVQSGEWTESVPLEVRPDPRWTDARQEDYQAQLGLALEVSDLITEAQDRIRNIRALREQIQSTAKLAEQAGHGSGFKDLAEELSTQLTAVEDQLIQNKAEASQDNINYPRVFSNHIGRLYSVLTGDHHRPTAGVLERYEDLKVEYAGIVADYDQAVEDAISRFNTALDAEKVERLILPKPLIRD